MFSLKRRKKSTKWQNKALIPEVRRSHAIISFSECTCTIKKILPSPCKISLIGGRLFVELNSPFFMQSNHLLEEAAGGLCVRLCAVGVVFS